MASSSTDEFTFGTMPDLSKLLIKDMALVKVSQASKSIVVQVLEIIKSRFLIATSSLPRMISNRNDDVTIGLLSKLYSGRSGYASALSMDSDEQEFRIILPNGMNKESGLSYKKLHKMYIYGTSKTPKFNYMPSQKEVHNMALRIKGQLQNVIMRESIRIMNNI